MGRRLTEVLTVSSYVLGRLEPVARASVSRLTLQWLSVVVELIRDGMCLHRMAHSTARPSQPFARCSVNFAKGWAQVRRCADQRVPTCTALRGGGEGMMGQLVFP